MERADCTPRSWGVGLWGMVFKFKSYAVQRDMVNRKEVPTLELFLPLFLLLP